MADTTAVYRAVADFSALKRQADAARRALRRLKTESSDTHQDYVEGQEEVTEATDDSSKSNLRLVDTVVKVGKATRDTTQVEQGRVDVLKSTVAEISKQTAAQRDNTRIQIAANQAKDKLRISEEKYTRVAEDAAATDRDRAKALDDVRLASIAASAANDQLVASMARLAVGGGGRGGRPRGPGIATDVGAFGRALANVGAGLVGALLLVTPTINTIIAGLVGIVSLLGTGIVAAAAFAAAFVTAGVAMAAAAFKFRDLIGSSTDGVSEWRAAIVAVEAAAFDAFNRVAASFQSTEKAGTSMWDSIIEGAVLLFDKMVPIFIKVGDAIQNFTAALSGDPAAYSPLLNFFETWLGQWKQLKAIVNRDILPGGVGFFEKYEEPAKAFVQGIGRVINAVRKFSAMGLGLNMDQLAEFIRTVFDVLSQLIGIIPRYSNALVKVGLSTAKFAQSMVPLIENIVKVGEFILQKLVAPFVAFVEFITEKVLNLPIVDWLVALGGGFVLAAKGVSILSFGLLKFGKIISGAYLRNIFNFGKAIVAVFAAMRRGVPVTLALANQGFPKLGQAAGKVLTALRGVTAAVAKVIPPLGKLGPKMSALVGSVPIAAAAIATWFLLDGAMKEVAETEERVAKMNDRAIASFAAGNQTLAQTRQQFLEIARTQYNEQSNIAKFWTTMTHLPQAFGGTYQELVDEIGEENFRKASEAEFQAYVTNAEEAIHTTGMLTDAQVEGLEKVRKAPGGTKLLAEFVTDLDASFKNGIITAGQYATVMEQLGLEVNSAGEEVDTMALKVDGAALIISQALVDIGKDSRLATGGISRLGAALGEDTVTFARDAQEAFLDLEGGILGTGEKVKEWFLDTSDAIREWKTEVADNFDLVKQAFSDLGSEAKLTWDKFKTGIEDAIEASEEMNKNIKIISEWASPKLLQFIAEAGPAAAGLYDVLAERGKKGVQFANQALREGADLGMQTANNLADALGLAMEPVVAAVELFISKLLGIPVKEVRQQVDRMVTGVNDDLDKIKKRRDDFVTTPTERRGGLPLGEEPPRVRPRDRRRYQAPGGFNTPSELSGGMPFVPEEEGLNQDAVRRKYETVGRVGVAGGTAAGMIAGLPEVKEASITLADGIINATKQRFGMASPSKVFASIGRQVVAGFTEGITDPEGWNSAIGAIVSSLTGIKDTIVEMFENARTWLGGIIEAFKHLYRVVSEDLTPAVDDLQTALENLPASIFIDFDLDTSKAEEAANNFLENMEKKGLIFQTPTGKQVLHEGGPAGHAGRFATGRPKSGEVDARLQRGEYVFSRKSVQSMGGLGEMDSFHNFLQGKRLFHTGGPVDESEDTSAKIRRLAESLGISGVTATGVLPKQKMTPEVSVSAPGAGKVGAITAAAANYMATIKKNFPMITGYGTVAVRTIAGTNTWSQHAYGNAIDVMTGSSTALRQAVAFFSNQYRRILSIAHLLADPWFASPRGDHYNHVHADFFPQYGGTPPGQPYRKGGKVRGRGGRVHQNEFVLRESAANALGTSGLDYLNTHADRYGPAAFLEAFNQSFATTAIPRMGGVGSGADGADGRAMFSIAMHLDGKTISRSVDVYSREADILLPGR